MLTQRKPQSVNVINRGRTVRRGWKAVNEGQCPWTTNLAISVTGMPVTLKVDTRQCDWGIVVLVGAGIAWLCLCWTLSHRLQLADPKTVAPAVCLPTAFIAYYIGWLALSRHDYIIVGSRTLTVSSKRITREWTWQQIDDVELHLVRNSRSPNYKVVRLYIPDAGDRFIVLPRFLCSEEGPETPDTIYELVRRILDHSRNRQLKRN